MENLKKAYVAGGCFWGMEDLFRVRPGVKNTEVGYLGGINENPTYRNHPKHAEGLEITYDSNETSYKELLDYFFRIHDPSTVDRQGNDRVQVIARLYSFRMNKRELRLKKLLE